MAPDGACGVAQSTARSKAEFEAGRFRKGFRKGFRRKRESVVESNDAQPQLRALTLGRRLRVLPNTKKRARAVISNAKRLRGTPEQRFRAAGGCGARPSSDFERKARPVRCFRMLSTAKDSFPAADWSGGFTI